jgi:sulfur-carrier protein
MTVEVRMFAAAREAAGTASTTAEAGPLSAVLAVLEHRYGPAFGRVLAAATVLIDGDTADRKADPVVDDGAEIVILPPFSGG